MNNNNNYKEYLLDQYHTVFKEIDLLMNSKDKVLVAIDGNSGAGKSTLSEILESIYSCNVFHMDHFFLRPELKTKERLDEVGGNVDYVRFNDEII
ncbi:MAG: uridine kinase, partial [Tissierellia bacterium]|nr:uridine kinase [Tissierellia bacterium]